MGKSNASEHFGSILDYVSWRGDISFAEDPWNEVDSLIIATIVYSNFGENELRFGSGRDLTIGEMMARDLLSRFPQAEMKYAEGYGRILLEDMACSRRFQNIRVLDQVNDVDTKRGIQFSAATFEIPGIGIMIGFRGTDSSLVGWKEDFMLGYETPVPSQLAAMDYLKSVSGRFSGDLYLSGHSKGGNLALYSAAHTDEEIQARLKAIYSFDGPGLDDETIESDGYRRIRDRVYAMVPSESVIGLLLNYYPNYRVVDSTESSLRQHVPFTWKVMGNRFLESKTVSRKAQVLDHSVHEWLKTCTTEQREILVTTLFTLLGRAQNKKGSQRNDIAVENLDEVSTQKMLAIIYRLLTIHAGNAFGEKIRKPLAMAAGELRLKHKNSSALFIRSNQINIDNRGYGFGEVIEEVGRMAEYTGLNHKDSIHLQLLAEEMLGMVRGVTGEWNASFRILCEGNQFQLLLTTRTLMDENKRALLASSTDVEKENTGSFQNKLRLDFEQAMLSESDAEYDVLPAVNRRGTAWNNSSKERWIRFEQSVLYRLADNIRIAIHGGVVFLTVSKAIAMTNMKTTAIEVDSRGNGFTDALEETKKMAECNALSKDDSLRLQLLAEEMLNMIRTVTGNTKASFWIEREGSRYDLLITTKTVMNRKKRELLIASASSGKNDAAKSFLGKVRNAFEKAMVSEEQNNRVVFEKAQAMQDNQVPEEEWDRYEQSVLQNFADDVKIGIRGDEVKMTVSKTF
ncbi:MAG: DUF2974 domain-containing protein [Oscillospiraceae bacterium]|nr:DUF2974 domain-containing protein [Oscillospiraceae bacterium]